MLDIHVVYNGSAGSASGGTRLSRKDKSSALAGATGAHRTGHARHSAAGGIDRIEVRFSGAKNATERLYALAFGLVNDYERFEALVDRGVGGGGEVVKK